VDRHAHNRIRRLEAEIHRLRREVEQLAQYRQLAYHDDLTGLRNRRYFEERLKEELRRAERVSLPCSLLILDVDDFKRINDEHGHNAGDEVLREVGMMLQSNARAVDIACRIGGDEMAIILPLTDAEGAAHARSRFEEAQASIKRPDGAPITLSFGTATYPHDAPTPEKLIERADRAMYVAKRKRKPSGAGVDHAA
jgi:diguanylate cyclase (GGDEF)-like protein